MFAKYNYTIYPGTPDRVVSKGRTFFFVKGKVELADVKDECPCCGGQATMLLRNIECTIAAHATIMGTVPTLLAPGTYVVKGAPLFATMREHIPEGETNARGYTRYTAWLPRSPYSIREIGPTGNAAKVLAEAAPAIEVKPVKESSGDDIPF